MARVWLAHTQSLNDTLDAMTRTACNPLRESENSCDDDTRTYIFHSYFFILVRRL